MDLAFSDMHGQSKGITTSILALKMPTDYYDKSEHSVSLYCAPNILKPTLLTFTGIGRNIFNSITNQTPPKKILKPPATLISA
jgi:hypothetical protein